MNRKKTLITWAILLAVEAAIVLLVAGFELSSRGGGTAPLMQSLSDGFFAASVLVIGCGLLVCIQEAGNFYGIQFLFYTLTHLFIPRRENGQQRKTYFDYCMEKKEQRAAEGKSPGQVRHAPDRPCLSGAVAALHRAVLPGVMQ